MDNSMLEQVSKVSVESPSLEVFKVLLDKALAAALKQGVKQMSPRDPTETPEQNGIMVFCDDTTLLLNLHMKRECHITLGGICGF